MATKSIQRLFRSSAGHRIVTTLLRPHQNLHRHHHTFTSTSPISFLHSHPSNFRISTLHFFSTARRVPTRAPKVDIGARARQLQNRRLWTYGIAFSCVAGFVVVILNQFEDYLVYYITPSDAISQYTADPSKSKFRLGGLVLEGSVTDSVSGTSMVTEFVITDLLNDILVRHEGPLPDLFREGHSAVVEGFVKPFTDEIKEDKSANSITMKARSWDCYFLASEVLAKHDEKYMPPEVAAAIEKNKKIIAEEKQQKAAVNG